MKIFQLLFICLLLWTATACNSNKENETKVDEKTPGLLVQVEDFTQASDSNFTKSDLIQLKEEAWLSYVINIPQSGRYKIEVKGLSEDNSIIWLEDYIYNKDDRSYNISGNIVFPESNGSSSEVSIDGAPLKEGEHDIKLHCSTGNPRIDWIKFTLIQPEIETPLIYTQKMDGKKWDLVWSDEFDGSGLVDSTKWSYNIGDWGWGNNELQYYTSNRIENARQEDGNLIIEARKNDFGKDWTSARLTTHGKEAFLYGKIEFRAKVPVGRGSWAAGWLLGDEYLDEISWPYCGEIDVLECVGFEIDDESGNGLNHCTCHTRSYYFKQGNQIGATIEVENMNSEYHVYAIEWYPDVIYGLMDGVRYYTYDKNKDELEWPFFKAQNIILNLAIGGGWGGAEGVDEDLSSQQYIIDYVRVYQLK